ncbi:hypothetical protein NPIL_134871 [Nephila pilipes]|uniref:Uncharacterized protein n=1 Tax=Nephila pilipes TaxID=299642 RepID=A0A8X6P5L1_NEPPI|nr:hypothetical protein NPIL_134871 [Nephila pilipes]
MCRHRPLNPSREVVPHERNITTLHQLKRMPTTTNPNLNTALLLPRPREQTKQGTCCRHYLRNSHVQHTQQTWKRSVGRALMA